MMPSLSQLNDKWFSMAPGAGGSDLLQAPPSCDYRCGIWFRFEGTRYCVQVQPRSGLGAWDTVSKSNHVRDLLLPSGRWDLRRFSAPELRLGDGTWADVGMTVEVQVLGNMRVLHPTGAGSGAFLHLWLEPDPCRIGFGCGFHFSPTGVSEPEKTQNRKETRPPPPKKKLETKRSLK
jgi:hypothetical protein